MTDRARRITLHTTRSFHAPSRRVRRVLSALVAASTVSLLGLTGAAQAAPVTFKQSYKLGQSSTSTLHGTPDGVNGCVFPAGRMKLSPSQHAVEMRETALNAQTCTATIEQGVPPDSSLDPSAGNAATTATSSQGGGITGPLAGTPMSLAPLVSYATSAGYEKDWWQDPPGIDVNKTISHLTFHYGNGCVHNPVSWDGQWFWYTTSGWSKTSSNNYGDATCGLAYSSSYAHFHNGAFCLGANVDTYYDRTVVYGDPDGSLEATWNSYNTGAVCKSLLGFHRTLTRTT